MRTYNIHHAKTQFSQLVESAVSGETIVIAKAGKPVAKLTRIESSETPTRLGFLRGHGQVPDDFDTMGGESIVALE